MLRMVGEYGMVGNGEERGMREDEANPEGSVQIIQGLLCKVFWT